MNARITAASRIFLVAGIYGIVALLPQYFMEARIGSLFPPAITHPENFYGFIGVALAWQFAFLVIARDVARYRLLMLPATFEKLSFGLAGWILFAQERVAGAVAAAATVDVLFAALFLFAYRITRPEPPASRQYPET